MSEEGGGSLALQTLEPRPRGKGYHSSGGWHMCTYTNSHPGIYAQYPNVHVYTYDTLWTYDLSLEQQGRDSPHTPTPMTSPPHTNTESGLGAWDGMNCVPQNSS